MSEGYILYCKKCLIEQPVHFNEIKKDQLVEVFCDICHTKVTQLIKDSQGQWQLDFEWYKNEQ